MPTRLVRPVVVLTGLAACSSGGAPTPPPPPPPPPSVQTVEVNPPTGTVVAGGTLALTATPRDGQGTPVAGQTLAWNSSNPGIASVSSSGVVTGVTAGGPVTITASAAGKSGTAAVTVTAVPVATVTVSAPGTTVGLGSTMQLAAELRGANGTVLTGRMVNWSSSAPGIATVSGTGLVTGVTQGGPVTITASSEGRSGTATVTVVLPPLAQGWQHRRQLTITTDASAAPAGYSIAVTLDHQALVAAGKSLASGNDLRVARWTGNAWQEIDRVLDAGSTWNSSSTRIWFRTQAPIAGTTQEQSYYVHYGNAAAGAPPANPDNVFLFADDYESGTLARWSQSVPSWSNVATRPHRGTRSMRHGAEGPQGRRIVAAPELDVGDVYLEAWWNVSSLDNTFNVAQMPRFRSGTGMYYSLFCLCIGAQMGFNIASYLNNVYTDIALPTGNPQPNTWMRVGTAMHAGWYRVFFNNQLALQVNNLTAIASGNIGFDKFVVPAGNEVWIDDVVARRFVFPEPTSTTGPEL
jgi:hypothetical protein